MPQKSIRLALNDALHHEMQRDPSIICLGEDISGGAGCEGEDDAYGGVFGVTKGLVGRFGRGRVIDTPISESAIIGAAGGAALTGLRPVVDLMFVDFLGVCFDQIYNQIAKFRYMFGGTASTPLVIRAMIGGGVRAAAQHSQTLHSLFTAVPGLKVAMPANAYDAKGLLIQAIRDNDPVIFLEHKMLYEATCEVPDDAYTIPFGEASIVRDGSDLTVVAFSLMAVRANEAAALVAQEGISVEVIDPRTTSPLDLDTILESVAKTGRLVVVDESPPRCSMATDISAQVSQEAFSDLRAPIVMVTCPHTPVPFSPVLEDLYMPSVERIADSFRSIMKK